MSRRVEFAQAAGSVTVLVSAVGGDHWRVRVGSSDYEFRVALLGDGGLRLQPVGPEAGPSFVAHGAPAGKDYQVRCRGRTFVLRAPRARQSGGGSGGDGTVLSPMTGTVLEVRCRPGDAVAAGQTLIVLSAMKMEHKLTAGLDGIVRRVDTEPGRTADQGDVLVVVEPAPRDAATRDPASGGEAPSEPARNTP